MASNLFKNTILEAMDAATIARLGLKQVKFHVPDEIEFPGRAINYLVFLEEGMASQTITFENGSQVEVGMFGYESVIGVSALMGTKQSLNRVYTQIAGWGYQCSLRTAQVEFDNCGIFHRKALRYVQAQLVQVMQSAGCNVAHSIEQRLARWLLLCSDRVGVLDFKISHEFLAHMLGTTRPVVTVAAAPLREEGLIKNLRGEIVILDRAGLEKRSCECYGVVKRHLNDYAAFDTKKTA